MTQNRGLSELPLKPGLMSSQIVPSGHWRGCNPGQSFECCRYRSLTVGDGLQRGQYVDRPVSPMIKSSHTDRDHPQVTDRVTGQQHGLFPTAPIRPQSRIAHHHHRSRAL